MTTALEFNQWINHVQSDSVDALLKQSAEEDIISFAGGLPSAEIFPTAEIEEAFRRVSADHISDALQYNWSEGYDPLRAQIAEQMLARGIATKPDEILVTNGAQQSFDLIVKLLARPDDPIALETPTYPAAIQAFEVQTPRFCAIERTEDGLSLDNLGYILRRQKPKFLYLVPTGHNPIGSSLDEEQRLAVIEEVTETRTFLVEDGSYSDVQYGEQQSPLKSYDDVEDRIIYVGSFSKVFAPGLRVGWLVAPAEMVKQLAMIKAAADLQTSSLSQLVVSLYLSEHTFADHICKCIDFYRQRRDCMLEALERSFPSEVSWTHPSSGFSIWARLPEELDTDIILKEAVERKVAFEPGRPFFPTERHQNFMRLSFSNQTAENIEEGIGRLGELLKEEITKL